MLYWNQILLIRRETCDLLAVLKAFLHTSILSVYLDLHAYDEYSQLFRDGHLQEEDQEVERTRLSWSWQVKTWNRVWFYSARVNTRLL